MLIRFDENLPLLCIGCDNDSDLKTTKASTSTTLKGEMDFYDQDNKKKKSGCSWLCNEKVKYSVTHRTTTTVRTHETNYDNFADTWNVPLMVAIQNVKMPRASFIYGIGSLAKILRDL